MHSDLCPVRPPDLSLYNLRMEERKGKPQAIELQGNIQKEIYSFSGTSAVVFKVSQN